MNDGNKDIYASKHLGKDLKHINCNFVGLQVNGWPRVKANDLIYNDYDHSIIVILLKLIYWKKNKIQPMNGRNTLNHQIKADVVDANLVVEAAYV